jgi:hypothetical protein
MVHPDNLTISDHVHISLQLHMQCLNIYVLLFGTNLFILLKNVLETPKHNRFITNVFLYLWKNKMIGEGKTARAQTNHRLHNPDLNPG